MAEIASADKPLQRTGSGKRWLGLGLVGLALAVLAGGAGLTGWVMPFAIAAFVILFPAVFFIIWGCVEGVASLEGNGLPQEGDPYRPSEREER